MAGFTRSKFYQRMRRKMESEDYVRLIVSDLHLGSAHSKEKELLELLSTIEYDELVLAGDIIEFLRKPEFTKDSIELLKSIVESEKKIIYLVGNHDDALSAFAGNGLKSIQFMRSYDFEYGNRKYRIQHGDQYRSFRT